MLRRFCHSFQRVLTLSSIQSGGVGLWPVASAWHCRQTLSYHSEQMAPKTGADNVEEVAVAAAEGDSDYIVPYRAERETRNNVNTLIEALRTRFRLTATDVKRIMSDDVVCRAYRERSLLRTLDTLCLEGVTKRSFMEYPWLVTLDKARLEQKLKLLQTLAMRDVNHFVPFLRLSVPRLRKLVLALNRESEAVAFGNRVYYISERLQVEPSVVTKYLAKRLFILEMPFDMLEQNLQHMIDYKVSPLNVLKDLWAFRYTPKSVQLRLERARRAKKEKIMPWMVRCPEPILQRSLKLSLDELAVLGGKASVIEYVAERLEFSVEDTKAIMTKHPQVMRVRVTKIKEVLDYLLDEAGFTRYEIAQVPRIMCHSLETTKHRLQELQSHGCRPTTLVIVCRSRREYEKFLRSWQTMKEKGFVPPPLAGGGSPSAKTPEASQDHGNT